MPIPVFLQHIDGNNVDVLLLRDPTKSGYRGGIEGVGGNIESVADEIGELAQIGEYRSAVAIGVSGGGLPAVITAVRLCLNSALSVGGNSPFDPRWVQPDGKGAADILLRNIKAAARDPMVMLAFGSGSEVDMKAAEALRGILSAELIRIGDDLNRVGHVALDPLVKSGTFSDFLNSTVF